MHLINWQHELVDFKVYKDHFEYDHNLSVIANAVDFCNESLSKRLKPGEKILEVGCGTQSVLKDELDRSSQWDGIDVYEYDEIGEATIATKIGSVGSIPFENSLFDYVLANQSIEHWHEYGVSPVEGLREIRRVLKNGGTAIINFPIHLHGHRDFVRGDFNTIDANFSRAGLDIVTKTAFIDSRQGQYKAWRKCGFPDFYVSSLKFSEQTSYCVEYSCTVRCEGATNTSKRPESEEIPPRLSPVMRVYHHGLIFLFWKFLNAIRKTK